MQNDSTTNAPAVHLCIATGQNAANLIPLLQYDAREIWILRTEAMRQNATNLQTTLGRDSRVIRLIDFDDNDPARMQLQAEDLAQQLDGRRVVLHATGGTKLMVLAIRDGLRLVEAGTGSLAIIYADTQKQRIDWLGRSARTEHMSDVLDLNRMLLVQGYRIVGDNRHAAALQRARDRAAFTGDMGRNAGRYGGALTPLATLARAAADSTEPRGLAQILNKRRPTGVLSELLGSATRAGLLTWDGDMALTFPDTERAEYFAGGWIEEFALLKLAGMFDDERFSTNLQIVSAGKAVPNELDAMIVHRNRALLIECKTGNQKQAPDKLYKLAQLRQQLGGSVASALYLSAQKLEDHALKRADEYKIDVLHGEDIGKLVPWLEKWRN